MLEAAAGAGSDGASSSFAERLADGARFVGFLPSATFASCTVSLTVFTTAWAARTILATATTALVGCAFGFDASFASFASFALAAAFTGRAFGVDFAAGFADFAAGFADFAAGLAAFAEGFAGALFFGAIAPLLFDLVFDLVFADYLLA